jgi:tetratricopeptide (TPR) repeat protein
MSHVAGWPAGTRLSLVPARPQIVLWDHGRVQEDPLAPAQRYASTGDHATAIRLARELEAHYADSGDLTMLTWVRVNLARWLAVQRRPDRPGALNVLEAAEETWRSPDIQHSEMVHVLGAELMSLRSFVLRQLGRAADSLAASEQALELFSELDGVLSPVGRVPILLNKGASLADLGRTAESLEPLTRALDILRSSDATAYREVEIELLVLQGTSLTLLGRFAESEAVETEAIALARPEASRSARHLLVAALNNYATTLTRMRRLDEALDTVRQALGVLKDMEAERRRWGIPLTTEAEILLALGRKQDAARSARLAEPIMREYAREVPLLVASSLANVCLLIGDAEDDLGYAAEALERFTVLKEEFPGRYDFWWRRATDLVARLSSHAR